MKTFSANIAQPLETPNWNQLRVLAPEPAAACLAVILRSLDRIEEQAFAVRGEAMLLIEERNLFRFILDDEVGDYYVSFDKWLKDTLPRSWGYCRDALRARKECADIPYEDFTKIKRCNIEHLKKVSSNVRALPEVVEAAIKLPEKEFVRSMNNLGQHLEQTETLKETYPVEDAKQVKAYLRWVAEKAELADLDDYASALLYLAIHELQENQA